MKKSGGWRRYGPLGLILLVLCLIVASRWMAWYEWIVGDTHQKSGLGGPRLPRDPLPALDSEPSAPLIEYEFGAWQGQDAIPIGMTAYLVLLLVCGGLCWATLARAFSAFITLEIAFLCCFVGILVWLGVLPFLGFWVLFRSGLVGPIHPEDVLVVRLDVTYVRLCLRGPLAMLAAVLFSMVAFVWGRMRPSRGINTTVTQQA